MNVLVLGATSDIARALVEKLAKKGDRYLLAARSQAELATLAADLRVRTGAEVSTLEFDACDPAQHADFVSNAIAQLGSVDGVIVAFGYLGDQMHAQREASEAARILEVNYTAAVSLLEPLATQLERQRSGWILGLSSVAGVRGRQSNYLYGSAKGAFTLYLEGLAHRLASTGVQVKIAKLGFVQSKMTRDLKMPAWAVVSPQKAADGLAWLLRSPLQSAYIPWRWWPIMTLIRALPAQIFNRTKL